MYGRAGLERFKKAQSAEPFSVGADAAPKTAKNTSVHYLHSQTQQTMLPDQPYADRKQGHELPDAGTLVGQSQPATQIGGGQSSWQPPDWAIEPRHGVYYLEVLKDGEVLDKIHLDRKRHIFGRQVQTCDFVLDHQSVSRQHATVVPHKNGSIFVIDLGSAHGTFVANERLTKDNPVEIEVGQSLRFAASTRVYILRRNDAALFPSRPTPSEINLPPPPDPSDEEAVLAYNTLVNRYGLIRPVLLARNSDSSSLLNKRNGSPQAERAAKKSKKAKVAFKDQVGGELIEVVGVSDGADVETEPGPVGVKEGSLVGQYESLVQVTVIPKGREQLSAKENNASPKGVTSKLQAVMNKIKTAPKSGIYEDLYGESFSDKVGSSWAYPSADIDSKPASSNKDAQGKASITSSANSGNNLSSYNDNDNDDDLFGD